MAITIETSAYSPTPAHNRMIYTLSSTNSSQPNFKYIADVYINNSASYTRLKVPAHPTNGYGAFNLSNLIKNYATRDVWTPGSTGVVTCPNSVVEYDVRWGEEYGPSSGVVTYQNLNSSLGKYAINAALDEFVIEKDGTNGEFNFYQFTSDHLTGFGGSLAALTNYNNFKVTTNDDFVLDYYNDNTKDTTYLVILTYDVNNNLLGTYKIDNPQYPSNTRAKKRIRAYVGPRNLNLSSLVSGSQPIITASVYKYFVALYSSTNNFTSDIKTFYIDSSCGSYLRLTFLNQWGAYDSINCYGGYKEKYNYSRSEFKQNTYTWSGTSYGFSPSNRGLTQFNNKVDYSLRVYSGWKTEEESKLMEQMFRSNDVRIVDIYNNVCVPVTIKDTEYIKKTYSRDGLFQYEFDVMVSFDSLSQSW